MRQRPGRTDESGQELRVRLDHLLRDLTPEQRIDFAMVLMAEGVHALRRHEWEPQPVSALHRSALPLLEISRTYSIGQRRLYQLVHSGEIASIRLGKRILILPETIETWLKKQKASARTTD